MSQIQLKAIVTDNGKVLLHEVPFADGQELLVILAPIEKEASGKYMTVGDLLDSGLFGIWADRTDIEDSAEYVHTLRRKNL